MVGTQGGLGVKCSENDTGILASGFPSTCHQRSVRLPVIRDALLLVRVRL